MPRINLDLEFLTHPKTVSVSPLAQLLFIRSIIYAARHLTDGFIPAGALTYLTCDLRTYSKTLAGPLAESYQHTSEQYELVDMEGLISELESVGWWMKITGGYDVHDFLEYQLSRRQVHQLSEKHKQSGKKGGLAKALANAKPTASKTVANVYPLTNTNKEEKTSPLRATVNDEWLNQLKNNPAYQHVNLAIELGKMDAWLAKPGNAKRKKTPSFILNWLNKIEAPITNGSSSLSCPHCPTLTLTDKKAKDTHDFIYHPKYVG